MIPKAASTSMPARPASPSETVGPAVFVHRLQTRPKASPWPIVDVIRQTSVNWVNMRDYYRPSASCCTIAVSATGAGVGGSRGDCRAPEDFNIIQLILPKICRATALVRTRSTITSASSTKDFVWRGWLIGRGRDPDAGSGSHRLGAAFPNTSLGMKDTYPA